MELVDGLERRLEVKFILQRILESIFVDAFCVVEVRLTHDGTALLRLLSRVVCRGEAGLELLVEGVGHRLGFQTRALDAFSSELRIH